MVFPDMQKATKDEASRMELSVTIANVCLSFVTETVVPDVTGVENLLLILSSTTDQTADMTF